MRIANKEMLPQNPDNVVRPSVLITVKRYMPHGRRYTVSYWSGWPMDSRMYFVISRSKAEALLVANKLAERHL